MNTTTDGSSANDDRAALADIIHDDQREQCDLDPEGFYDCEQLADRIIAAGWVRGPHVHTEDCCDGAGSDAVLTCGRAKPTAQAAAEAHPRPAASAQEQDAEEMAKHLAEKHGIAYPVELGGLASWILAVVGARNQTIRERDAAQATAERLRAALAWFAGGDLSDAVVCTVTPQGHYETLAPFRDFQLRARAALAASGSEGQPRGLRPLAPEGITDALVIRLTEDPALLEAFACYEGSACGIDEVQGVVRAVLTAAARSAPPTPEGKA
jgi:hypothetical protein